MAAKAGIAWTALRELHGGAAPIFERLGTATGRDPESIRRRAKKEGWAEAVEPLGDEERKARLRRLTDWAIEKVEAIKQRADDAAIPFDKAEIEAASALMRMLEKLGEITRSAEGAKENQVKRDADMAGILKRIDHRIIELATGYAEQLGAGKSKRKGG